MFDRIMLLFQEQQQQQATQLPEADAQHAIGALLVRAAKADQVYLFEEMERIDELLAHRFKLSLEDAQELRAECEVLDAAIPDAAEFAGVLRDAISYDERVATILALWEVVYADGYKIETEELLLTQLEELLGVPAEKSKELHDLVADAT